MRWSRSHCKSSSVFALFIFHLANSLIMFNWQPEEEFWLLAKTIPNQFFRGKDVLSLPPPGGSRTASCRHRRFTYLQASFPSRSYPAGEVTATQERDSGGGGGLSG